MSQVNIVLDDLLVEKCKKATEMKSTNELIDYALKKLLRRKDLKKRIKL